ncbi:hypothetical protein HGM15179_012302 [Zosterops borbonicus]|uniref:Uncharacterized protein n=1 Tax=Zosterops borbonicus TaxID=364589 RepID=A0A8K1LI78_9PASS|nr:hypothetical protein HGM15179_012302 [Zosterops borbonicus]
MDRDSCRYTGLVQAQCTLACNISSLWRMKLHPCSTLESLVTAPLGICEAKADLKSLQRQLSVGTEPGPDVSFELLLISAMELAKIADLFKVTKPVQIFSDLDGRQSSALVSSFMQQNSLMDKQQISTGVGEDQQGEGIWPRLETGKASIV